MEASRRQPSRNQTYFQAKKDIVASGEMSLLELNYQDKHDSVMETAKSLTKAGLSFTAARNLHRA